MTNNAERSETVADDAPVFKRRQVLSGIGGMMATGAIVGPSESGKPDDLAERMAAAFSGVRTARDRETLEYLVEEMEKDAELLAVRDLSDVGPAKRREFAEKGRLMKGFMAMECGYEGYEVTLGEYTKCCEFHDGCETYNDGADSVFNGDECDDAFWSCVTHI